MRANPAHSDPSPRPDDAPAPHADRLKADAEGYPPSPSDAPGDAPEDARTADEYTEPPGSHRRPSDGAALDVGG